MMKRKLMTMLACCAVISGSLAVGTVSDKAVKKANASDYDNSLWAQYFDVCLLYTSPSPRDS